MSSFSHQCREAAQGGAAPATLDRAKAHKAVDRGWFVGLQRTFFSRLGTFGGRDSYHPLAHSLSHIGNQGVHPRCWRCFHRDRLDPLGISSRGVETICCLLGSELTPVQFRASVSTNHTVCLRQVGAAILCGARDAGWLQAAQATRAPHAGLPEQMQARAAPMLLMK